VLSCFPSLVGANSLVDDFSRSRCVVLCIRYEDLMRADLLRILGSARISCMGLSSPFWSPLGRSHLSPFFRFSEVYCFPTSVSYPLFPPFFFGGIVIQGNISHRFFSFTWNPSLFPSVGKLSRIQPLAKTDVINVGFVVRMADHSPPFHC